MITIQIKGMKMRMSYETEDKAFAVSFLHLMVDSANFENLIIEIKTTKEKVGN